MVQVDVFWSYALGAGFALAAARQLAAPEAGPVSAPAFRRPGEAQHPLTSAAAENGPILEARALLHTLSRNPYFTWNLLYLALLFAPSGAYLLWGFTSWETMHADVGPLPPWLVTAFALTNVSQGALGFAIAYRLIRQGRPYRAYLHFVAGYFAMFFILVHGWDGRGYQRFFSPTREAFLEGWSWQTGVRWLSSDVALTLYGMGVLLLPVLFWMMTSWIRDGLPTGSEAPTIARRPGAPGRLQLVAVVLASSLGGALGFAIVSSLLIHLLGWLLGGALAAIVIATVGVSTRGIFPRLFRRMLWVPDPRDAPSHPQSAKLLLPQI